MRCGRRWRRNCRSAARGFSGVLPQAPELSQRQRMQQDRARHRERRNHDDREGPELRDLFSEGSRKFADFERSLTGISATTLSARLKKLEEHHILARRFYAEHPPRAEHLLTEKGRTLGPILKLLLDRGTKHTR